MLSCSGLLYTHEHAMLLLPSLSMYYVMFVWMGSVQGGCQLRMVGGAPKGGGG